MVLTLWRKSGQPEVMVSLFVFAALIFLFPMNVQAQADSERNPFSESSEHDFKSLSEQERDNMRNRICLALNVARTDEQMSLSDTIDTLISEHGEFDETAQNHDLKKANFWNAYSPSMSCPPTAGLYPQQHVFKRAILMAVYSEALNQYFLADSKKFPIDMNVIEVEADGTPTTVLDFIDYILAREEAREAFNVGQIIRLRRTIEVRFDGKRAIDMDRQELEKRLQQFQDLNPSRG
ncbi:hypothetical protein GCM10009069_29510 [Algimonas arctica]|uniref:Uncharacterized protein n=1 Tax=Algimonas arctica TaxID=1479486 RepID=A0A8J3G3M0_9PROT|nr:hypothetical protein [Algimonas arctica]GHB05093.1 hypothetical protein GCM10009069_29510 [Algimonas arctica]